MRLPRFLRRRKPVALGDITFNEILLDEIVPVTLDDATFIIGETASPVVELARITQDGELRINAPLGIWAVRWMAMEAQWNK